MAHAVVVTVSNRAAAGVYADTTGPLIVDALTQAGHDVGAARVVPDGEPLEDALRSALQEGPAVIVTTGGTGISPTDRTPEITRRVISGVRSVGEIPVPPVVTITAGPSCRALRKASSSGSPSGTTRAAPTSCPACVRASTINGPVVSA